MALFYENRRRRVRFFVASVHSGPEIVSICSARFLIEVKIEAFDNKLARAPWILDKEKQNRNPHKELIGSWETLVKFKQKAEVRLSQPSSGSATVQSDTAQPDIEVQAQEVAFDHMADIATLRKKARPCCSQLSQLKTPGRRVLELWKESFENSSLSGKAHLVRNKPDKTEDLVALTEFDDDLLSRCLRRWWPGETTELRPGELAVVHFKERSIAIAVAIITVLLVGSITALYFVQRTGVKLALVAIFTLLFSLSLVTITKATRTEVVASTAA
ncbi:hypothetical protein LTS17_000484 [Exophiala oligosperma]